MHRWTGNNVGIVSMVVWMFPAHIVLSLHTENHQFKYKGSKIQRPESGGYVKFGKIYPDPNLEEMRLQLYRLFLTFCAADAPGGGGGRTAYKIMI